MSKSRTFKTGRIAVFAFAVIIIFTCLALLPYNKAYADTTPITSSNVPDGVYAIRNASSGRYLGVDSYETGTYLRAYSITAEPSTAGDRAYMFKIEAVGTSGNYIIRTMSNNYNSFAPVSSSSNAMLRAAEIPTTNSSVPTSSLFTVTKSTNGYTIKKNAGTYFVSQQSASGTAVVMASSSALSEWELIPMSSSYYSVGYYGGSAGVDHDIAVGETETVRTYFYSTNLSHNSVMMSLRSEDFALANTGTNTTNTMTVTPTDIGLIRHQASIKTKTGGTATTYLLDFVNIHFADGVYSLKNNYSGKYMYSKSTSAGHFVAKGEYSSPPSVASQRAGMFKLEYTESANNTSDGGYYGIRTMFDNSVFIYIASEAYPNVYTSDQNPADNPNLKWKILKVSSGNYVLAKYGNETDPIVATFKEIPSRAAVTENDDGKWYRETLSSAGERAYWTVTKYTGSSFVGVIPIPEMNYVLYNNSLGIQADISQRITSDYVFYSTTVGHNDYNSISGYTVCDVNGNAFESTREYNNLPTISNTGSITVPEGFAGMIGIRVKYNIPYGSSTTTYTSEPVRMYISPGDDSYLFISNLNNFDEPKYLTTVKTSSGYVVRYEPFTYSPNQMWRKIYSGEYGYNFLINVATGLYLVSPESNASGSSMLLKVDADISNADCAMWKCTDSGALTGKTVKLWKSKYMENNTSYVLSASGNSAVQSVQSSTTYHANIGIGGDVVIFGADTWDVPSSQDLVAMRIATNLAVEPNGRYNYFSIHTFVNSNSTIPASLIDSAKIYIHMGHGGSTGQAANKSMTASLNRDSFSNLSNLHLVMFMGCKTAGTTTEGLNLPAKATSVGSAVSVGFVNAINDDVVGSSQSYTTNYGNFYKKLFELLYSQKSMRYIEEHDKDSFSGDFKTLDAYFYSGKDFSLAPISQ